MKEIRPNYTAPDKDPSEGIPLMVYMTEQDGKTYLAPMSFVIIDAANLHVYHTSDGRRARYLQLPTLAKVQLAFGFINGRPC